MTLRRRLFAQDEDAVSSLGHYGDDNDDRGRDHDRDHDDDEYGNVGVEDESRHPQEDGDAGTVIPETMAMLSPVGKADVLFNR